MNMRLHMNKKMAELFFIVLMLLCMKAQAESDNEFIHKEVQKNQERLLATVGIEPPSLNSTATKDDTQGISPSNANMNAEKELSFWSGFIDSLSMIFFVEFGDRV